MTIIIQLSVVDSERRSCMYNCIYWNSA